MDQCRPLVGAKISGQVSRLMLRLFAAFFEMNERPIAYFVMRAKCQLESGEYRRRAPVVLRLDSCPVIFSSSYKTSFRFKLASETPHET